ncbi:MAG TPA: amidohydrolase family protein [Jiangellaceae bacterium]|jgi:aminocarboxymuconate-semialdehyde decarboxylase|nr:amidohydrolase family protein [Jiangellaceae bacterium]
MPSPGLEALDVHTHAMPMPLLEALATQGLADLSQVSAEIVRLDPRVSGVGPSAPLPLARSMYDVQTRLHEMKLAGVSHHAVALPPFLFGSTAEDASLVRDLVRRGNDELASYVATAPDQLVGLGFAPVGWAWASEEARRCLDELGMHGLTIGSRGAGNDLDDPVNNDFWAFVAGRRTFVFLHPSGVPDGHRQRDFWLPQLVGYPMETALAVARMAFGGVLERYAPTLCLAHGGGCLSAIRGRLDMGWERKEVAHTTAVPPSQLFDRLYYDTAVFSTPLLERLVADVGVGNVLLGTDHPFELGERDPVGFVRRLGLDDESTSAILWRSAAALLGLVEH